MNKEKAAQERERLFQIIEDLVQWENTNNEEVLARARAEIWKSWRKTCALNKSHPQADERFPPTEYQPDVSVWRAWRQRHRAERRFGETLPIIARPSPRQRGSIRARHNQFLPLFLVRLTRELTNQARGAVSGGAPSQILGGSLRTLPPGCPVHWPQERGHAVMGRRPWALAAVVRMQVVRNRLPLRRVPDHRDRRRRAELSQGGRG